MNRAIFFDDILGVVFARTINELMKKQQYYFPLFLMLLLMSHGRADLFLD